MQADTNTKVRLDKWLWAARFYKTRSLAKHAIEGGKVYFEGNRVKVSKEIHLGALLRIRQGYDEKTVVVEKLSVQRGNATIAATLYSETADSIHAREQKSLERKAAGLGAQIQSERPNKRERRKLTQFKHDTLQSD